MSGIGFVLEKVRHGSELSTGEAKMLADEIDRVMSRLEGCAQEVARRETADKAARQADRERTERLRQAEEEVTRLRGALEMERQRRQTNLETSTTRTTELESLLKDIHYGLLHQPEHSRKVLADVIAREVTPYPDIPWGPEHPAYDEMGQ